MSKHLLECRKRVFVQFCNEQPQSVRYQLMSTGWNKKTELARWRRLHIKTMNYMYTRQLKEQSIAKPADRLPAFLRPRQIEIASVRPQPAAIKMAFGCKYCPNRSVPSKRRRPHTNNYHLPVETPRKERTYLPTRGRPVAR